jgi:crotonobetainyl-CoA:carnitine CoA-transferase CaiB-like acyl-CoA transferase
VLNWTELFDSENFKLLDMVQTLRKEDGFTLRTLRSPIRVNGERGRSERPAPRVGEHTEALRAEFGLT